MCVRESVVHPASPSTTGSIRRDMLPAIRGATHLSVDVCWRKLCIRPGHVAHSVTQGVRRCVSPPAGSDLGVDVCDMALDGPHAQHKLIGDFGIGTPIGNKSEDFRLARRE